MRIAKTSSEWFCIQFRGIYRVYWWQIPLQCQCCFFHMHFSEKFTKDTTSWARNEPYTLFCTEVICSTSWAKGIYTRWSSRSTSRGYLNLWNVNAQDITSNLISKHNLLFKSSFVPVCMSWWCVQPHWSGYLT
jgi:hypothetical protein